MDAPTLFTLGTPYGRWPMLAAAIIGGAAEGRLLDPAVSRWHREMLCGGDTAVAYNAEALAGAARQAPLDTLLALRQRGAQPWGGSDALLCWTADALAARLADARFLIWVERPADALAHWLAQGGAGDPRDALAAWKDAAQRISRLVQQHRPRCMVVLADEARVVPRAVAQRLGHWLAIDVDAAEVQPGNTLDPLPRMLAERIVADDAACVRAFDLLYASCEPLMDGLGDSDAGAPAVDRAADRANLAAGIEAYRRLCRGAADAAALQLQLLQTQDALEATALKQQNAEARLAVSQIAALQSSAEVNRLDSERVEAAQQGQLALSQLQQARHELAAAATQRQDTQAKLAASLDAARQANAELTQVRADLAASAQESELMLLQLHQVQEELERYYLAWRELDETVASGRSGAIPIKVEKIDFSPERDTPPLRELSLTLRGVRAADRALPLVEARLVEHHGRPGLAFFVPEGAPPPLMAWQPSGSEGDRPYMLLVPADEPSRQLIQRLGTGDWQFAEAVAAAIARALDDTAAAVPARWRAVAARLVQQLADLPLRLRFDGIDVATAAAAAGALDASFVNLSFGSRQAARVRLRWWPQSPAGAAVELLAPEAPEGAPLWAAWPVDDSGAWRPGWPLPLAATPSASRAQAWRALGPTDRTMLLGVLDALPAVAERATAAGLVDANGAGLLAAAAGQPLRVAMRALHGTRWRRVARALKGRIDA